MFASNGGSMFFLLLVRTRIRYLGFQGSRDRETYSRPLQAVPVETTPPDAAIQGKATTNSKKP